MTRYEVSGSVLRYGSYIGDVTKQTTASSPKKAMSNALAQVKKELNLGYNTKLTWATVKVTEI